MGEEDMDIVSCDVAGSVFEEGLGEMGVAGAAIISVRAAASTTSSAASSLASRAMFDIDCEERGRVLIVTLLVGDEVPIVTSGVRGGSAGFEVGSWVPSVAMVVELDGILWC